MNTVRLMLIAVVMPAWLVTGCAVEPDGGVPAANRAVFEEQVLPLLLRDCGFHACHGSSARFLQVFGPGHGRIAPETRPLDPLTLDEIEHSFTRTLSMLDPVHLEMSPLLRKPLAIPAGGAGHEGTDELGRNVYQSKADPSFQLLQAWVMGAPLP
jgi:hypothetical protein